jgi:hypothetical protein
MLSTDTGPTFQSMFAKKTVNVTLKEFAISGGEDRN